MITNGTVQKVTLQDWRSALANEEIQVYYQPVVRAVNGKVSSYEALSRWIDPEFGFVSPELFIPFLERVHRTDELDLYVVEHVLRDLVSQREIGMPFLPVSINLSQNDFEDRDMVQAITDLTEQYDIPRELIILEITESACIEFPEALKKAVDGFHQNGFQVWMDDFGSGYSSLNVLQLYDFDLIKLDMRFLEEYSPGSRNEIIIRHIIAMAHDLGILTLVEGVETAEQFIFLKSTGCDRMQGYYFRRPIPFQDFVTHAEPGFRLPFEDPHSAKYYDEIAFHEMKSSADMPSALFHRMQELPQALIESNKEQITFLRSNDQYLHFLVDSGLIDPNCEDPNIRGEWQAPATPGILQAILASEVDHSWVHFTDMTPFGKTSSWLKVISENPITNTLFIHLVVESLEDA